MKLATCKHCNNSSLRWKVMGLNPRDKKPVYRLFDSRMVNIHICPDGHEQAKTPYGMITESQPTPQPAAPATPQEHKHSEIVDIRVRVETVEQKTSSIEDKVAALLSEKNAKREVEVSAPSGVKVNVGRQHEMFETLVRYASLRLNVFLRGPAGSGKTSAAHAVAKALNLPYYHVPLGPQTSKSDLLGYMNGAGNYVISLLRQGVEGGGVILLDEIDAANPAVLTIINGILANGTAGFPDGMVEKHPDCVFIAAGNTYGRGADNLYVGRAQLDAATLDRWVMLNWEYDWSFTAELSGDVDFTTQVRALYERASSLRLRVVIGPRAAIDGARMLKAGIPLKEVLQHRVWNGISVDDRSKIEAGVR